MKNKMSSIERSQLLHDCKVILSRFGVSITTKDLIGTSRAVDLVFKRSLVAYLLRKKGLRLAEIGAVIGRDHTTALYLLNKYPHSTYCSYKYPSLIDRIDYYFKTDSLSKEKKLIKSQIKQLNDKLKQLEKTS